MLMFRSGGRKVHFHLEPVITIAIRQYFNFSCREFCQGSLKYEVSDLTSLKSLGSDFIENSNLKFCMLKLESQRIHQKSNSE